MKQTYEKHKDKDHFWLRNLLEIETKHLYVSAMFQNAIMYDDEGEASSEPFACRMYNQIHEVYDWDRSKNKIIFEQNICVLPWGSLYIELTGYNWGHFDEEEEQEGESNDPGISLPALILNNWGDYGEPGFSLPVPGEYGYLLDKT